MMAEPSKVAAARETTRCCIGGYFSARKSTEKKMPGPAAPREKNATNQSASMLRLAFTPIAAKPNQASSDEKR